MNFVEIITPEHRAALPRYDTPEALIEGLQTVVRPGIDTDFDDVVWSYHHGPAELAIAEAQDYCKLALSAVEQGDVLVPRQPTRDDMNVLPQFEHLARRQATSNAYYSVAALADRNCVAMPARQVAVTAKEPQATVDIRPSHGISFDGLALVFAMRQSGFRPGIVTHRRKLERVYREHQFSEFFLRHAIGTVRR